MLEARGIETRYGAIQALHGVDLSVGAGEIVTLIGANGAGKSTLLMTLCGVLKPSAGRVLFEGADITGLRPDRLVRHGIAQVPEGRRIFPRMTVFENLQMGAGIAPEANFKTNLDSVYALFPRLAERAAQRGGTLSGGEQQMLAIGRALMSEPRLLMLDEPSLGLAPLVVRQIFDCIRRLNAERKLTVLLVEQNAHMALKAAHRGHVLVNGRITLSGTGDALLADPQVRQAYLEGGAA